MEDVPMRRVPQQARGQQRVDLILDTAAELIAAAGYEALTTNAIAERAGISIGSLYQYFADKDAILRALAKRYSQYLDTLYEQIFTPDLAYLPLPVLLDRLLTPLEEFHLNQPAFERILIGADVSPDIAAAAVHIEQETLRRIQSLFQLLAPGLDPQRAHVTTVVVQAVFKALLSLQESSADEAFRAQVRAEVRRLLLGYVRAVLEESNQTE